MRKTKILCLLLVFALSSVPVFADATGDAITLAADTLFNAQDTGPDGGFWSGETTYAGTIMTGLVEAYSITGNPDYLQAAELSGNYIVNYGEMYGDEIYGLCALSTVSSNPAFVLTTVTDFFDWVKDVNGTQTYIDGYGAAESSVAVYYLAHLTLAAYFIDADDKTLFREGLIEYLATVDNDANYPVMSLAVATWALAQTTQTGSLENTPVNPTALLGDFWYDVELTDLPDKLAGYQVPSGSNSGTFFWLFDYFGEGYTEEVTYAVLALTAVQEADPARDYSAQISLARPHLAAAVQVDGSVHDEIMGSSIPMHYLAGELLQALAETVLVGDIGDDGCVDIDDLFDFFPHWLKTGCSFPSGWGGGADLNHDGTVNLKDFAILSSNWTNCI